MASHAIVVGMQTGFLVGERLVLTWFFGSERDRAPGSAEPPRWRAYRSSQSGSLPGAYFA